MKKDKRNAGIRPAEARLRSAAGARMELVRCEKLLFLLKRERETLSQPCLDEHGLRPDRDTLSRLLGEQERELTQRIADSVDRIRGAMELIDLLRDERQRTVLFLRYVDCLAWNDIQQSLEKEYGVVYDIRQVYRFHAAALRELGKRAEQQDAEAG